MKMAWVQIDPDTQLAVRIFKNHKLAIMSNLMGEDRSLKHMDRGLAVSQIRRQIWNRQEGLCARCPEIITFQTSQMHERVFRSQGGEISLENSELICAPCHRAAHPEKQLSTL